MRDGAFPGHDDPIDDGGLVKAQALRMEQRSCITSPSLAAGQTAAALGIAATTDMALRDMDHADWAGRTFGTLHADSPDLFANWMANPASGAPGGESLATVRDRMANWLADQCVKGEDRLAITHPMVIRATIAAALDIPPEATLRVDLAPLAQVRLSWNRVWRLQAITS